jgi:VCBS repeat protein/centrosomal CEP192-like protein
MGQHLRCDLLPGGIMKLAVRTAIVTSCLICMAFLAGCGGGSSIVPPPPAPLTIATANLPPGTWETPYSQVIQATGGVAPYTWSVSAGALPHNLSLSNSTTNTVTISGTPDVPGSTVGFTIKVTDSASQVATQAYEVLISSSITVFVSPQPRNVLPNKTQPFTATVNQDPTHQGVTWTLTQGGPCSPGCGTVAPSSTASGAPTTYTAPATAPANPTVTIVATSVADGTQSGSANFAVGVPNSVPFLAQPIVPATAAPSGAALTLTVNGTGFVSGSSVKWNGIPRATTFVSSTKLTAAILASDIANPNTAAVSVFNPTVGGGTSNRVFFPVASTIPSVTLRAGSFVAGSAPVSILTADFRQYGIPDLAVTNLTSNSVSVLLGNLAGDGTFGAATSYATGTGPSSLAAGDFDGDGNLDLVVTTEDGHVSVLLNRGDGTFLTATNYLAATDPVSVAVADFNGDGYLDLAVADRNCSGGPPCAQGTVSILLGNGDGTFQGHVEYPTAPGPNSVTVGDFNGDGKLDLAVAAGDGGTGTQVSVLLGNGDGTFQSPVSYTVGLNPVAVATADFNNDGKLDLAVVNNGSSGSVSILLGNGDGTFQTHVDYPTASLPHGSLAVGDFNDDGQLDLAVADNGSNALSVLLGNGDGTFQAQLQFPTGQKPLGVAVGDFNKDGRLDFAIANRDDNTVSILLQSSSLTLSSSNLSFGTQIVGTPSSAQTETLTNIGTAPLTINISATTGTNPADFGQSSTCGSSLVAGASCTIAVTFTPGQVGPSSASITISDDSAGSPLTVSLGGTGVVSGPNVTLSATSLSFPDQVIGTTSSAHPVTLSNYGTVALSLTSIGASANFGETNDCGSNLASAASCTIMVTFTPSAKDGLSGTLSLTDNAPGSPQAVSLSGAGTVVGFSPPSLSFRCNISYYRGYQCICSGANHTTLTNTGTTTLSISSIAITGPFSETNTCDGSVGAGQSCSITVSWSRTTGGGAISVSDDGGGSPQTVPLVGSRQCR